MPSKAAIQEERETGGEVDAARHPARSLMLTAAAATPDVFRRSHTVLLDTARTDAIMSIKIVEKSCRHEDMHLSWAGALTASPQPW